MTFDMRHNLRYKKCYTSSIILASDILGSYLVTSLIPFEDGTYHLHSYVEYKGYVIDYTKNLIMKKDKYEELLKVKELGSISSSDVDYIFRLIAENSILNTVRYLATFGEEIKNDLEKNKQLLKLPDSNNKADFSNLFI